MKTEIMIALQRETGTANEHGAALTRVGEIPVFDSREKPAQNADFPENPPVTDGEGEEFYVKIALNALAVAVRLESNDDEDYKARYQQAKRDLRNYLTANL